MSKKNDWIPEGYILVPLEAWNELVEERARYKRLWEQADAEIIAAQLNEMVDKVYGND